MSNKALWAFMPKTLEERIMALNERMCQAWPNFGRRGDNAFNRLYIDQFNPGTMILFYREAKDCPLIFDPVGAVRHGSFWQLSDGKNVLSRMTCAQMRRYMEEFHFSWVEVL